VLQKVLLHKLSAHSVLFTVRAFESEEDDPDTPQADLWEEDIGNAVAVRKIVAGILKERFGCVPIWEPDWLLQHEKALRGFVHAGTPEGLLKVAHNSVRQCDSPLQRVRKSFDQDLNADELGAVCVWIGLAQRDGCTCGSSQIPGWKSACSFVRAVPLFCPFSNSDKRVALADFDPEEQGEDDSNASWCTAPTTCPEVVKALRAANVELKSVVEVPSVLERGSASMAVSDAVAALLKELSLPRLTWTDVMLRYVFPWANGSADAVARQGLLMTVVQQWKAMELGSSERCAEILQKVPFVATVAGEVLSPSQLLDPSVEELRRLYGPEGMAGPFPSAEVVSVLTSAPMHGVLRFRRELTVHELIERLMFLHERSSAPETTESVVTIAESLLQYVADHVAERCTRPPKETAELESESSAESSAASMAASAASTAAGGFSQAAAAAGAFFSGHLPCAV
jgi:hypothetical protein